jgi:hypothetical protein
MPLMHLHNTNPTVMIMKPALHSSPNLNYFMILKPVLKEKKQNILLGLIYIL